MQHFRSTLYEWYNKNRRELPWRETNDPYRIWISEIILQQTRVAQGLAYYERFAKTFPTIEALASASEDQVLKLWQGLGYYSRALNLHAAAKTIVAEHGGRFPQSHREILALKGIGPYTAAAIASIAFALPHPAIDGNVYRVLSRWFGISTPIDSTQGKKEFAALAKELLDPTDPGRHNEALMEFGALQCVPQSPDCENCPVNHLCYAYQKNVVSQLPVKEKKTRQTERFFYYYLLETGNYIYIEKRTGNDIWKNLYQLPLLETANDLSEEALLREKVSFLNGSNYNLVSVSGVKKHILSHRIIRARVIRVEISDTSAIPSSWIRVNKKDIFKFAVPRLLELFFEELI